MDRRQFLMTGAAGLTLATLNQNAFAAAKNATRRVGLIGCGWYGKCDLIRLLQVSPVEVVSLCDVDQTMLNNAADRVAERQN
jgi:predicted homoserine dehydrogenase-like protein